MQTTDIFERLRNGETILPTDPKPIKCVKRRTRQKNYWYR